MAKFLIQATPASFIKGDGYEMVSVAMMSKPLVREVVEAKNLADLMALFEPVKAALMKGGVPFSLSARLVGGERAPSGWNNNKFQFRADQSFGIYGGA